MDDLHSMAKHAAQPQPAPTGRGPLVTPNLVAELAAGYEFSPSLPAIISGLESRDGFGRAKYGDGLRCNNGRDPAVDAWQEALDLMQYVHQMGMEGRSVPPCLRECVSIVADMLEARK